MYKEGDIVFIWGLCQFAKIESVRKSGNLITLWVKTKETEFPISALEGSNIFVIKTFKVDMKTIESPVSRCKSFINAAGWLSVIIIFLYFFGF